MSNGYTRKYSDVGAIRTKRLKGADDVRREFSTRVIRCSGGVVLILVLERNEGRVHRRSRHAIDLNENAFGHDCPIALPRGNSMAQSDTVDADTVSGAVGAEAG